MLYSILNNENGVICSSKDKTQLLKLYYNNELTEIPRTKNATIKNKVEKHGGFKSIILIEIKGR